LKTLGNMSVIFDKVFGNSIEKIFERKVLEKVFETEH